MTKDTTSRDEEVHNSEGRGSPQQREKIMERPPRVSPQRRSLHCDEEWWVGAANRMKNGGLEQQTSIFELIIGPFPKHINRFSLEILSVRTLREGGSLLGFLLSLKLVPFSRIIFLRFVRFRVVL